MLICHVCLLTEVPHGQVHKQGSIPAQYLYNWVFVCVSLIEHNRKVRRGKRKNQEEQPGGVVGTKQESTMLTGGDKEKTDVKDETDTMIKQETETKSEVSDDE